MGYRLGVDLGTTYTAAAVDDGPGPVMLGLGNRALQMPSVLVLESDGTFLCGEAAERRALTEPERAVREFKRRIGDGVPILIGGQPFSPQALTGKLLRWVVSVATQRQGRPPDGVVVTFPANWGGYKRELLRQVVSLADLADAVTCTEPEAAATQYASRARLRTGDRVVVYDLGGGTFDVCVLEQREAGFAILGSPDGVEHLGGIDFDEAVFQHVWGLLPDQVDGLDPEDPAVLVGMARLRRDCVDAKEALSESVEATVPVALPGISTSVRLTRAELESLLAAPLRETVDATSRALRSAGLAATDLAAVVLVGGSSRIPLVSHLLQAELGVPTALDTHPKHDIALGAVRYRALEDTVPLAAARPAAPVTPVTAWPTRESPGSPPATPAAPPPPAAPSPPVAPRPDQPAGDAPAAPAPAATAGAAPSPAKAPAWQPPPVHGGAGDPPTAKRRAAAVPGWRSPPVLAGAAIAILALGGVLAWQLLAGPDEPAGSQRPTSSPTPGASEPVGEEPPAAPPLPAGPPLPESRLLFVQSTDDVGTVVAGDADTGQVLGAVTPPLADYPLLSPDRRTLLYVSDTVLRVTGVDGQGDRPLLDDFTACPEPRRGGWSPVESGRYLVLVCGGVEGIGVGTELVVLDRATSQTRSLATGVRVGYPTVSPDGASVAYCLGDQEAACRSLSVVPFAGGASRPLTAGQEFIDGAPAWSPDGQRIAFRRASASGADASSDVWTISPDGADPVQVTAGTADEYAPSWSPDGTRIALTSRDQSLGLRPRIWVVPADGSAPPARAFPDATQNADVSLWSRR